MSPRSPAWDFPTGVHDPVTGASSVISDIKRRARIDRLTSAILKIPDLHHLTPAELTRRQRLLASARRGSKRARDNLWRLYRLRLLTPLPASTRPRMSKRHAK